jgi:hypothetical protein
MIMFLKEQEKSKTWNIDLTGFNNMFFKKTLIVNIVRKGNN